MKKILGMLVFLAIFSTTAFSIDLFNTTSIGQSSLRIYSQQTYPATIEPGNSDVVLQITLYHGGDRTYKNITIEAKFQTPFQPVKNTYFIAKMDPKDTYTILFRFNVDSGTDAGVYTIPLSLKYIDTGTTEAHSTSDSRDVYLQVSASPKLEFTDIDIGAPLIGGEFTARFTVKNTGGLPATDVSAAITANASAYTLWVPDRQVISMIPANTTYDILFAGRVSSQTQVGPYVGLISLAYGTKTASNNFVLDIKGDPTIKLAGVSTDEDPHPGQKVSLSLQLENTGTGDAKAVKVTISDDSVTGIKDSYIGTIETEDTGSAIFDLTFSKAGANQIPVTIEYEDGSGVPHTMSIAISTYVYSNGIDALPLLGLVVLAAVLLYFFFGRRKKHRQLKKLEE